MNLDQCVISAEKARKICDPDEISLGFPVATPIEFIGQERAEKALSLALSSPEKIHTIVVANNLSVKVVGKYLTRKLQEKRANGGKFAPKDYCYVYNFSNPDNPSLLVLPAGDGILLKLRLEVAKSSLKKEFSAENVKAKKQKIDEAAGTAMYAAVTSYFKTLKSDGTDKEFAENGWILTLEESSICWRRIKQDGKLLTNKAYKALPEEEKRQYKEGIRNVRSHIDAIKNFYLELADTFDADINAKIEETVGTTAYDKLVDLYFDELIAQYRENAEAAMFLEKLKKYTKENRNLIFPCESEKLLLPTEQGPIQISIPIEEIVKKQIIGAAEKDPFLPFEVNLVADNEKAEIPPVIVEETPTHASLFGTIERELVLGAGLESETQSSHMKIKAGSFYRANGGFLVINLDDIFLGKEIVYLALLRVMREKTLRFLDYYEEIGMSQPRKIISPEPAKLDLRIIGVVSPAIYYHLVSHSAVGSLLDLFKMKAEFRSTLDLTQETFQSYCAWIREYAKDKGFLPLSKEAQAKIIEVMMRVAGSQERIIWNPEKIKDLLKEAQFYAEEEKSPAIGLRHIRKTIKETDHRNDLIEEAMTNAIRKEYIKIETAGECVGQINALGICGSNSHGFGMPLRVTANTYRGGGKLVQIQREADFTDETHIMGIEILKGFFNQRYGQNHHLNFEGRLVMEQNYSPVFGASASAAELFALVSSLAEVPIKQGLAITGTVDQRGSIGAIGGVNEKIESFFNVCKLNKLTGNQGVIIPKQNARDLMLSEEVVEAIKTGEFHIFAIETVNEGLMIITGKEMSEIDKLVNEKIKKWSKEEKKEED